MDERVWTCEVCGALNRHVQERVEQGVSIVETVLWCHGCQSPRDASKKPVSLAEDKPQIESHGMYYATATYTTMPYWRPPRRTLNVLKDSHFHVLESRMLDSAYYDEWAYSGLIVARSGDKYVPYSASGAYGKGSEVPVGILHESYDVRMGDVAAAPLYEGNVIENFCYEKDKALGQVDQRAKRALKHIKWI